MKELSKEERKNMIEKYNAIRIKLDKMLDEELIKTDMHIRGCRQLVLKKAKDRGIINDYRYALGYTQKNNFMYWGSKVGFDSLYIIRA